MPTFGRFENQKKMIFTIAQVDSMDDQAIIKAKFNYVVEYPIWVSIKRTLMGRIVLDGQNLI